MGRGEGIGFEGLVMLKEGQVLWGAGGARVPTAPAGPRRSPLGSHRPSAFEMPLVQPSVCEGRPGVGGAGVRVPWLVEESGPRTPQASGLSGRSS